MAEQTILSSKILELRKSLNLTQAELGKQVGVSGGAISHFEKGLNKPNAETVRRMSEFFDVELLPLLKSKELATTNTSHSLSSLSNTSKLGRKIVAARKRRKLSQAKLAKEIGVSRASIALYESGGGNPSISVLEKLAEALDMSFSILAIAGDEAGGFEDYSRAALAAQRLEEANFIRSSLIKHHFEIEEKYIEVDLFPRPGYIIDLRNFDILTSKPDSDSDTGIRWPTLSVLKVPGVDYTGARVTTVRGSRMAPRYPDKSKHVVHPITDPAKIRVATGPHAFLGVDRELGIRYITSNNGEEITLTDATGSSIVLSLENISMLWRVGQAVYMPAED